MRRLLATVLVLVLMGLGSAAVGVTTGANYLDVFSSVTYGGSDGSIPWNTSWREIGERDGPSFGWVQVALGESCPSTGCLRIEGAGEETEPIGASRAADLSGYDTAIFHYQLSTLMVAPASDEGDARLYIEVSDDMNSWRRLERIELYDPDPSIGTQGIDVSEWISARFGVRFFVEGLFAGAVLIDNVEIAVGWESATTTSAPETTTTTESDATATTKPITTTTSANAAPTRRPEATASTSHVGTTTTIGVTTTTTIGATTSTTRGLGLVASADEPPRGSGLRNPGAGLQFDHEEGLMGAMDMEKPQVLGIELDTDYSMAVELVESSWIWLVALLIVIATAIVTGIDRRKGRLNDSDR